MFKEGDGFVKDIFTIGYSSFKVHELINILKQYGINSLIDVRSNPNSKYYEDYNKNTFERLLKFHGIIYRNYKDEFGARQEDAKYYPNGYLDFELFTSSSKFLEGVDKIKAGMDISYKFVFMCAEKDPSTCHRNIMVAKEFYKKGYNVKNILADGTYEAQDSIEKRLVNHYFPNKNQVTLFSQQLTWGEMVKASYEKRNEEIGYRINDEVKVNIS